MKIERKSKEKKIEKEERNFYGEDSRLRGDCHELKQKDKNFAYFYANDSLTIKMHFQIDLTVLCGTLR